MALKDRNQLEKECLKDGRIEARFKPFFDKYDSDTRARIKATRKMYDNLGSINLYVNILYNMNHGGMN